MSLAQACGVLGVPSDATAQEARRAYKRRAQLLHPDKHATLAEEVRAEATRAMSDLTIALEVFLEHSENGASRATSYEAPRSEPGPAPRPSRAANEPRRTSPAPARARQRTRGQATAGILLAVPVFVLVAHLVNVNWANGREGWLLWFTGVLGVGVAAAAVSGSDLLAGVGLMAAWAIWIPALITGVVLGHHHSPDAAADSSLTQPTYDLAEPTQDPQDVVDPGSSEDPALDDGATGKPSPTPPPLTCAALSKVSVTYVRKRYNEDPGYSYWPAMTVINRSKVPVEVTFSGHGKASNVDSPDTPLEMDWGVDDSPLDVAPGKTGHEELGHQYGEDLYVGPGDRITQFRVGATVATQDGELTDCPTHVRAG